MIEIRDLYQVQVSDVDRDGDVGKQGNDANHARHA